jgi:hypothetical protein
VLLCPGDDPLARLLFELGFWSGGRRVRGGGATWEEGGEGLPVELAERFERQVQFDRLSSTDPGAYVRAVGRQGPFAADVYSLRRRRHE